MKYIFLAVLLLVSGRFPAFASTYGYIRAVALPQLPGHSWTVQLYANDNPIGPSFSQTSGFDWLPLAQQHLSHNENGRTPIYASYSGVQGAGFQFDFEVEFSLDGHSVYATIGKFHAPISATPYTLPLSLCGDHDAQLCSWDRKLQGQIIERGNREALTRYYEFKQEYDRKLRERREKGVETADALGKDLVSAVKPDFREQEELLRKRIAEWSAEFDKAVGDQLGQTPVDLKGQMNVPPEQLIQAAEQKSDDDAREARIRDNAVGNLTVIIMTADLKLAEAERQQRELKSEWMETFPDDLEGAERHDKVIESIRALRREVFHGGLLEKAADIFLEVADKFAPSYVQTAFKLCDIVVGRKYCIGKELKIEERKVAACQLAVTNLPYWRALRARPKGWLIVPLSEQHLKQATTA